MCRSLLFFIFLFGQVEAWAAQYCSDYLYTKMKSGDSSSVSKYPDEDWWGIDGARRTDSYPYETFFEEVLGNKSFSQYFSERKQVGESTHLLDLFGSGIVSTDFSHIDSITGVRLVAVPITSTRVPTLPKGHYVLAGDLFDPSTWDALKSNLKKRGIDHIDIITVRPAGAFLRLEHELAGTAEEWDPSKKGSKEHLLEFYHLYMKMIARGYELTGPSSEMFIQLPTYGSDGTGDYKKWIELLEKNQIKTRFDDRRKAIRLTKTPKSPSKLPI